MSEQHPKTLTDHARYLVAGVLDSIGMALHRLGVHPDLITIIGTLIVLGAAVLVAQGQLIAGGLLLMLGLPFDALDGAVARAMNRSDRFGAVLDSSLDRYADGFIFAALSYYFAVQDKFDMMLLALAALIGSFLVSYVRARAEGVNVVVKVGLLTRLERVIVILLILLLPVPGVLELGLLVLAVGTNFTGLYRLWFVYRTLNNREV